MTDFDLTIERRLNAPPNVVFDAWTTPEKMQQWWGLSDASCSLVEIDLRIGGAYRIANALPDGRTIWISGRYTRIRRPGYLEFSWSVDGGAEERVELTIEPDGDGSRLTIQHLMVPGPEAKAGHQQGWSDSLAALKSFLRSSE